jgi:hypothetical protein
MIPNILHFIFGMAPDFGGKPFSIAHYLSIKSALKLNKPEKILFHYQYEPSGEWWQRTKPLVTLNKITAPDQVFGNTLYHVAHKSDVLRLQMLKEYGGIYLDLDTISLKPLTGLLGHSFVIGQELKTTFKPRNWRQYLKLKLGWIKIRKDAATGLCNAVLLAEKNSAFIYLWLQEYKSFRSRGRDIHWSEHSVEVPMRLAHEHKDLVTILSPDAFHLPLYDEEGLRQLFDEVHDFPNAYLHHLWESFSWNRYLSSLTPEKIRNLDSTYNLAAREYLD